MKRDTSRIPKPAQTTRLCFPPALTRLRIQASFLLLYVLCSLCQITRLSLSLVLQEEEAISFEEFEKPTVVGNSNQRKPKVDKFKETERPKEEDQANDAEKKDDKLRKKKPKLPKRTEEPVVVPVGTLLSLDDPMPTPSRHRSPSSKNPNVASSAVPQSVYFDQALVPSPEGATADQSPVLSLEEATADQPLSGSEATLLHSIDLLLKRHLDAQASLREREREVFRRELQRDLPNLIDKAVQKELKVLQAATLTKNVTAAVTKSFNDTLTASLPKAISVVIDKGVKESLGKYLHQENVSEAVTRSLMSNLQPLVIGCFRDTFANIVVPNFERSAQQLFAQMHQTFQRGIDQGL